MDLDYSVLMFSALTRSLGLATPVSVFVEGNVGAGKSTALTELKFALEAKGKRVCLFLEQTERWSQQGLLRGLYDGGRDGKRAFDVLGPLRDYVDRQRFCDRHAREYDVILFERHPSTALHVFCVDADVATRELYRSLDAAFPFMRPPEMTVYLKVSPEECLKRLRGRNRPEEQKITETFLKEKHEAHEKEMRRRRYEGLDVREIAADALDVAGVVDTMSSIF